MHIFHTWDKDMESVFNWTTTIDKEGRNALDVRLMALALGVHEYLDNPTLEVGTHSAVVKALIERHPGIATDGKVTMNRLRVLAIECNRYPAIAQYVEYYEAKKELHYLDQILRGERGSDGRQVPQMW